MTEQPKTNTTAPSTAPPRREWSRTEVGWLDMRQQLSRLRRRALARPIQVSLVTLLAVGAVVGRQAIRREVFTASVTFRVAEQTSGSEEGEGRYQTKSRLREYVADGVLTKQRVLLLIRRFKLYPKLMAAEDETRAIDEFRDDIKIKVYQNYFLKEDWEDTGKARSARVKISFTYIDPEIALKTARGIGETVKEHEADVRRRLTKIAAIQARTMAKNIRKRIDQLETERAEKRQELAKNAGEGHLNLQLLSSQEQKLKQKLKNNPSDYRTSQALKDVQKKQRELQSKLGTGGQSMYVARLRVSLSRLDNEIDKLELALERADSTRTQQNLHAALEKKNLLMRFEAVDWGKATVPQLSRSVRLSIVGAVLFFMLWPIIGIGVGAFNSRVHDLDDVRHLKLEALGHVPKFPGIDVGQTGARTQVTESHRRHLTKMMTRAPYS